jgi:ParB family chromosome partitioning protein
MSSGKSKRGGLGRGIGALIPTAPASGAPSPTDIFFGGAAKTVEPPADPSPASAAPSAAETAATVRAPESTGSGDDAPSDLAPVPGAHLREIGVGQVRPNARQPRTVFDDDALAELTHSVREFGVLQPIVVRQLAVGYELVMGERRLRAATAAGLETVPAIVRDTTDDAMLRDALLENIHRAQLNPLEEAAAYQQLLDDFGVTHEELAGRIGRSRSHLSNTVRLMNLSVPVQRRVAAGVLSAGHARALLALSEAEQQDELAGRIVAEGLSVRATEELVTLAVNGHLDGAQPRRRPVRRVTAPAAANLAEQLSDAFDTRVRVDIGKRKGKITVEFASIDDLERIVGIMAPDLVERPGG